MDSSTAHLITRSNVGICFAVLNILKQEVGGLLKGTNINIISNKKVMGSRRATDRVISFNWCTHNFSKYTTLLKSP